MSICWYCHWGWARPVADIYRAALDALGGDDSPLVFGPGHVVWSDENWDDECVDACLRRCAEGEWGDYCPTEAERRVVRRSLEELRKVPEAVRCCEPADYDDECPEDYPPPAGVEVVKDMGDGRWEVVRRA